MPRVSRNVLSGGEIGRQVQARHDVAKHQQGLRRALNSLGLPGGGQYNRPGFRFVARTYDHDVRTRLIPFRLGFDDGYALELGDQTLRVTRNGGLVVRDADGTGFEVTAATNANPLTVTVPCHGCEVGHDVYFAGIEGMTEINGRTLRVTGVADDVLTFGDVDSTGWGVFTGSGGGFDGCELTPIDPEGPPPFDPTPLEPPVLPGPLQPAEVP